MSCLDAKLIIHAHVIIFSGDRGRARESEIGRNYLSASSPSLRASRSSPIMHSALMRSTLGDKIYCTNGWVGEERM